MRIAWTFTDPVTSEIYRWEVNPREDAGSNAINRTVGYSSMAGMHRGANGEDRMDTILFESNVQQQTFSYTGAVYTSQQYAIMEDWCSRDYPLQLTDDLGRSWLVMVTQFTPARLRSRQSPYKHSYTFSGIVLEEL